nr:hypothetical protein Itr_chr10CG04480 [Ipomoea trifida]
MQSRPEIGEWRANEMGLSSHPRLSLATSGEEAGNRTRRRKKESRNGIAWGFFRNDFRELTSVAGDWSPPPPAVETGSWWWVPVAGNNVLLGLAILRFL